MWKFRQRNTRKQVIRKAHPFGVDQVAIQCGDEDISCFIIDTKTSTGYILSKVLPDLETAAVGTKWEVTIK